MKLTAKAEAQAAALGVVVDLVDLKSRLERQRPEPVDGSITVRLGRPSRARVVVVDDAVVAVLPSSPHAEAGAPDVRGGDPDRKRARDQERWARRGRPSLDGAGETPPVQMRLGSEVLAALDELVAAAGEGATRSSVVRQLVLAARR